MTASGPQKTDSKEIRIVDYDPSWPARFEEHAENIRVALGDNGFLIMVHIWLLPPCCKVHHYA